MRQLVRLVLFRYLLVARVRVALTVLGIVLGVSVVFAVKLVNGSVLAALQRSFGEMSGPAKLSLGTDVGVEEAVLEQLHHVAGIQAAIAVIETSVHDVRSHAQLAVLALDTLENLAAHDTAIAMGEVNVADQVAFLNDLHGVLVTPVYAQRVGVKAGDTLELDTAHGRQTFTVHGTVEPRGLAAVYGGDLLIMDVYAAQIAFERGKRFDRVDIVPAPGQDLESLTREVVRAVGPHVPVRRPERRAQEAERLLAGFHLALSLAGIVALFVGGFMIYSALESAVTQRRRDIGILRALGTTRTQVLLLFVMEGLLIGLAGTAFGLGFGFVLARSALGVVSATVSALYVPVQVNEVSLSFEALWLAAGLGLGTALVSAWLPAQRASGVEPTSAMRGHNASADVARPSTRRSARAAVLALVLGAFIAMGAHLYEQSVLAFAVAGLLCVAAAGLAPALAAGIGRLALRHAKRWGPAAWLGALAFARNRGRHAVSIAALGMALANVVSVDSLIGSLKGTTDAWLGRAFRADIFVFAGTEVRAKFERPLPATLRDELRALPQVEFVQAFRMVQRSLHNQPYYLMSEDIEGYRRYNELAVVAGDFAAAWPELEAGSGVAASEAFVRSFGIGLGDSVTLDTPNGPRRFRIVLEYSDYRADIGILFTSRSAYTRIFRDPLVDLYSVYLTKGASLAATRAQIAERFGERHGVLALGSSEYKQDLVGLVDRSMALSRATELVAVVVAGLGIVNALFVGLFDRRRELGVLKAVGTAQWQVKRSVLAEATLIACTSALLGVMLGSALSAYMVLEALRLEVGWSVSLHLSGWVLIEAFVLALPIAWVASIWPMQWAGRLEVIEALQHE